MMNEIMIYIDVNFSPSKYAFILVFFPRIIVAIINEIIGISILIILIGKL